MNYEFIKQRREKVGGLLRNSEEKGKVWPEAGKDRSWEVEKSLQQPVLIYTLQSYRKRNAFFAFLNGIKSILWVVFRNSDPLPT